MASVIFDSTKLKVYESLGVLCRFAGESQDWCDALWGEFLLDGELYEELLYYMKHHTFHDKMNCCGYTLVDLYVWQMEHYNLMHDSGKNTEKCSKVGMVLHAFDFMAQMKKNPEECVRRLKEGRGNDKL